MELKLAQNALQLECKSMQLEDGKEVFVVELPVDGYITREVSPDIPVHERVIEEERTYLDNSPPLLFEFLQISGQALLWLLSKLLQVVIELVRIVLGVVFTALGHTMVGLGQHLFGLMSKPRTRSKEEPRQEASSSKRHNINVVNINNIKIDS